jgi:hypothetical protein
MINYYCWSNKDSVFVDVQQEISSVAVTPKSPSVAVGDTAHLDATATDAGGTVVAGASFTWTSSNKAVATVNAHGDVIAKSAGSVTITVSADGKSASTPVTVKGTVTETPQTPQTTPPPEHPPVEVPPTVGGLHEPAGMTTFMRTDGSSLLPNGGRGITAQDAWTGENGFGDSKTALVSDPGNPTGSGHAIEKRWYGPEACTAGVGATTSYIPCTLKYGSTRPGAYIGRKVNVNGKTVAIKEYDGKGLRLASALPSAPRAGDAVNIGGTLGDAAGKVGMFSVWHWSKLDPGFFPSKTIYVRMRVKFSRDWAPTSDATRTGMKFFYLKTSGSDNNVIWTSNGGGGTHAWEMFWATLTTNNTNSSGKKTDYFNWAGKQPLAGVETWHTVEFLFRMNSAVGVADGVAQYWVDGVLVGNRSDVNFIDSDDTNIHKLDFDGLEFYPLRGSQGVEMNGDDWFRLGELYVSGKR